MQKSDIFLCSELIEVTAGCAVAVGNLEQICAGSCTVTLEQPLAIGTQVSMRCFACAEGRKACTECRYRGTVRLREDDPMLGSLVGIEFEGRHWSNEDWQPRHLTNVPLALTEESWLKIQPARSDFDTRRCSA